MSVSTHRLDRRADLLASKITQRIDMLAEMLRPRGGLPPFTTQQTNEETLAFWRKHRYSQLGQRVLAGRSPAEIMDLDAWLSRHPDPMLEQPLLGRPPMGGPGGLGGGVG